MFLVDKNRVVQCVLNTKVSRLFPSTHVTGTACMTLVFGDFADRVVEVTVRYANVLVGVRILDRTVFRINHAAGLRIGQRAIGMHQESCGCIELGFIFLLALTGGVCAFSAFRALRWCFCSLFTGFGTRRSGFGGSLLLEQVVLRRILVCIVGFLFRTIEGL